jgi:hypothetical protein
MVTRACHPAPPAAQTLALAAARWQRGMRRRQRPMTGATGKTGSPAAARGARATLLARWLQGSRRCGGCRRRRCHSQYVGCLRCCCCFRCCWRCWRCCRPCSSSAGAWRRRAAAYCWSSLPPCSAASTERWPCGACRAVPGCQAPCLRLPRLPPGTAGGVWGSAARLPHQRCASLVRRPAAARAGVMPVAVPPQPGMCLRRLRARVAQHEQRRPQIFGATLHRRAGPLPGPGGACTQGRRPGLKGDRRSQREGGCSGCSCAVTPSQPGCTAAVASPLVPCGRPMAC